MLFAQRILLKNVDIWAVVKLVGLSVPQILLYTIPFSTLSAASMVIGDLSERNEILALRASGISLRRMFEPIAVMGLVLALCTFLVADVLLPYSNQQFRTIYAQLLQDLPTIELESYSVNQIGDIILVTGEVHDDSIGSLVLFDTTSNTDSQVISATGGKVTLMDIENFLYRLELDNPVVLSTNGTSLDGFSLADANSMTYYLDFSNQVSRFTDVTPSQLSSRDLLDAIESRKTDLDRDTQIRLAKLRNVQLRLADTLRTVSVQDLNVESDTIQKIISIQQELIQLENQKSINFYLQYYRAELHKKIALSISCFVLVFITFPLSYLRLKHGRLFGFGLSLVVASGYWFLLFFAQTRILDVTINPGFLIWIPNLVIGALSALLLLRSRHV